MKFQDFLEEIMTDLQDYSGEAHFNYKSFNEPDSEKWLEVQESIDNAIDLLETAVKIVKAENLRSAE